MSTKPLNAESLRNVASWLDTYDQLAEQYFKLCELLEYSDPSLPAAREACRGDAIQRDLRRWADELEAQQL